MRPVSFITGPAAILDQSDIDTDQILPPRFLGRPGGDALFHDLRAAADPAFPLRPAGNPPILLTGANFGCGGAREAAVHALMAAGIRCIIAEGFADTFSNDAAQAGLLTVTLPPDAFASLLADVRGGADVAVDLFRERVSCAGLAWRFPIDPFRKTCLLDGLDELALTLGSETMDAIDRFEGADARRRPWATPS